MHHLSTQRTLLYCATLFAAILTGCQGAPPPTQVWSRDSKSFFYTQDDGTVVQYDLSSKSKRILLEPNDAKPFRAAVSPDGKLVAIATAKASNAKDPAIAKEGHSVKLSILRLADGKVQTTKTKNWGDPNAPQKPQWTSAYWCPSGKRILIRYDIIDTLVGSRYQVRNKFTIYDIASGALTEVNFPCPDAMATKALGTTPLVPDGSGYLVFNFDPDGAAVYPGIPTFAFIDWEGHGHVLKNTPEFKSAMEGSGEENPKNSRHAPPFGIANGKWEGNVLSILTGRGCVYVDPKKQVTSIKPLTEKQQLLFRDIPDSCVFCPRVATFPHTNIQVRCYLIEGQHQNQNVSKLEILDPQGHLLQSYDGDGIFALDSLSPDGKYLFVHESKSESKWLTYVIRDDGTVVDKVSTCKEK